MNNGFIFIHRKLKENPIYNNSVALHVWIECLLRAAHKDTEFYQGRIKISLKAGQFVMGRDEFGKTIGQSGSTTWYWINRFKVDNMIDISTSKKGTVVTIINWVKYQKPDSQVDRSRTDNEQHFRQIVNTYNNVNNINNNNGDEKTSPIVDNLGEIEEETGEEESNNGINNLSTLLKPKKKNTHITTSHQDQAFRFADALGIKFTKEDQKLKARWIKLFKDAGVKPELMRKVNTTYGYLIDYIPFNKLTNAEHKVKYFFSRIYGE